MSPERPATHDISADGSSNGGMSVTLTQAAAWIDGAIQDGVCRARHGATAVQVFGEASRTFTNLSTDSRHAGPGDCFVALRGDRFDAHDFLADVTSRGVAALIVSRLPKDFDALNVPYLLVPDTRLALGAIGRGWRERFDIPVVAVTGSNGKTTVKEMIASIFAAASAAYLATQGNLNNDIGVPLTLLRLRSEHRRAVIELGMNHPDETQYLAALTRPTVAVINNAQREHQEFMRTVEAVALEHASVIHALAADGTAVFPADDAYAAIWRTAAQNRPIVDFQWVTPGSAPVAAVFGHTDAADPSRLHITTPVGDVAVQLATQGEHNKRNALAATAAAIAAGVSLSAVRAGLEAFAPVKGRLQVKRATMAPLQGATVIDDTYNANPDSMRAAIDVLAAAAAPRVLIVGDMGEVGDQEAAAHREIGAYARDRGVNVFFALGDASRLACEAFGAAARHFASPEALVEGLRQTAAAAGYSVGTTILVKGSRFMAMERVVDALVGVSSGQH